MALKLIRSINALDGEVQFNSEPGRISGLLVVAQGTNATATPATSRDVGSFLINRNGAQTHNRNMQIFQDIGDIRAGTNKNISVASGAFLQSCFIPFFESGHPNALRIVGENELNIRYQPASDVGTNFSVLDVSIFARIADLPERYTYSMLGNDVSYSAAVQRVEQLARRNISALYLNDQSSELDRVQFEQNDRVVVSNISFEALQAQTVYDNRIEDGTFDLAQIMAHTPGRPGSTENRDSVLTLTTGAAANIEITVCSLDWGNQNARSANG